MLISAYIVASWARISAHQVGKIVGRAAPASVLEALAGVAAGHHVHCSVAFLRAFAAGQRYEEDVELLVPAGMSVGAACEVARELKGKLEALPDIESAAVVVVHHAGLGRSRSEPLVLPGPGPGSPRRLIAAGWGGGEGDVEGGVAGGGGGASPRAARARGGGGRGAAGGGAGARQRGGAPGAGAAGGAGGVLWAGRRGRARGLVGGAAAGGGAGFGLRGARPWGGARSKRCLACSLAYETVLGRLRRAPARLDSARRRDACPPFLGRLLGRSIWCTEMNRLIES